MAGEWYTNVDGKGRDILDDKLLDLEALAQHGRLVGSACT